jgi:molecular chaperone HscB
VSDPFETLGVEPRFELDLANVELRHRDLSRVVHPDRHTGAPPSSRRVALSRAIEVNQAFAELRDPVRRAQALLKRYGVTVEEGKEKPADPLLLMELLELGEGIADARRAGDAASVERQSQGLKAREKSAIDALGAAFRELEAATATATGATALSPQASAAADSVVKQIGILRFTRRLLDEAALASEELGS